MTDRKTTEAAAFKAMQRINAANFQLLMAYKYGQPDSLASARSDLSDALAEVDAALIAAVTGEAA